MVVEIRDLLIKKEKNDNKPRQRVKHFGVCFIYFLLIKQNLSIKVLLAQGGIIAVCWSGSLYLAVADRRRMVCGEAEAFKLGFTQSLRKPRAGMELTHHFGHQH